MEKFNYEISIEAPNKEIADMMMDYICKEHIDVLEVLKRQRERLEQKREQMEKEAEQQQAEEKQKQRQSFFKGMRRFIRFIQILERCANDETAIDRISRVLNKPKTATVTLD